LEQYYKDYPESLADLTIYQVHRADHTSCLLACLLECSTT
jgi:hypothetical protein